MNVKVTSDDFIAVQFDSTLLKGSGLPPSNIGGNGDYYLDRTTGNIYYKINNMWGLYANIKGNKGDKGHSSYTYIAYASDQNGSNFTTIFNPNLDYIAIITTDYNIENLTVDNFQGYWKNYKGQKGDTGTSAISILAPASTNLVRGSFVNVFDINGVSFVRYANATSEETKASGFIKADYTIGQEVEVFTSGTNTFLNGLTTDTAYYLSTLDGQISENIPSNAGNIIQYVGSAIDDTILDFCLQEITVIN
jgi:hypothetical protein